MKHIDHVGASVDGNGVTDRYISSAFNQQERMYAVDYDEFRGSEAGESMLKVLGRLQEHKCCYCMRRVSSGKGATLEHIIPQSVKTTAAMQPYFELGYASLSPENLIASSEFVALQSPKYPPRPHTVAYHNFALSCDGCFLPDGASASCNNYRGDRFINPVFLDRDIERQVVYGSDGMMYPAHGSRLYSDIVDFIGIARLNYKKLKEVRKIWYDLSKIEMADIILHRTEYSRKRLLLVNLTGVPKEINKLADDYKVEQRWNTLMSYSWFHKRITAIDAILR